MEPLHEVEMPEINYMERLRKELDSCCLPSIKDLSKATTDEITRDMYRVLTGNGNITGGLVVKIATANVNIGTLQEHIGLVTKTVNDQVKQCNDIQTKNANRNLADKVKSQMIRKTLEFIWENKAFIAAAVTGIALYINSFVSAKMAKEETAEMVKQLDNKVTAVTTQLDLNVFRKK